MCIRDSQNTLDLANGFDLQFKVNKFSGTTGENWIKGDENSIGFALSAQPGSETAQKAYVFIFSKKADGNFALFTYYVNNFKIAADGTLSYTTNSLYYDNTDVYKRQEYYYIGYTSCYNVYGRDNNVFVARSKNVYGPFNEKWNGQGWSTSEAQPVVYFDEAATDTPKSDAFGAGEPTFVVKDGVIYMYYTWDNNAAGEEGDRCV